MIRVPLEEKQERIKNYDKARAEGMSVAESMKAAKLNSNSLWKWRKEFSRPEPLIKVKATKELNGAKFTKIENERLRVIVVNQALEIQALKEYCGRQ